MTKKQWKIILWIVFTALFFAVFCSVSYLISHSVDWSMAILFFLVFGLLDKKGVAYLVDHYIPKAGNESKRDKEEK